MRLSLLFNIRQLIPELKHLVEGLTALDIVETYIESKESDIYENELKQFTCGFITLTLTLTLTLTTPP